MPAAKIICSKPQGSTGTLQWLSFWDEGNYIPEDFAGWANFGFSKDVDRICHGANMGQRHLLKVGPCFFTRSATFNSKHKKRLILFEDWEERWELFRPAVTNLFAAGVIFGVFLGDELLWSGLSLLSIETVANKIRADLPGAIIWMNEAKAPIVDGHTQFQGARFRMPPSIDRISVDVYHFTPDEDYVADLRRFYIKYLYPQLRPNQSVVLVPGAFSSTKNRVCDAECYEEFMAADADAIMKWAWEDDRVVGIAPYHWNYCPHCHGTRNEIGVKDMLQVKQKWETIGAAITSNQETTLLRYCQDRIQATGRIQADLQNDAHGAISSYLEEHAADQLLETCLISPFVAG